VAATKSTSVSSVFKNLKFLELKIAYTEEELPEIAAFLGVCPVLETLVLNYYVESDLPLSEDFKSEPPTFHIPNLKQVKMRNYRRTEMELYVVELLKLHNVVLEKIMAFPQVANGKSSSPLVLLDSLQ
ncbi:UNVERIFIED_CONTAM: hypothetical protein Sindi_2845900, partial [Sesamum indicum]